MNLLVDCDRIHINTAKDILIKAINQSVIVTEEEHCEQQEYTLSSMLYQ